MVDDLLRWLFNTNNLTPHGFCLAASPGLIWLHAFSDAIVGAAYFSIPVVLFTFVIRKPGVLFRRIAILFGLFILLCGTGHFLAVLTLWVPSYGIEGLVKLATAIVSVVTAIQLWNLLPQAIALPTPAEHRKLSEILVELQRTDSRLTSALADANSARDDAQRAEATLRALIETAPGMIYSKDRSGRMILANGLALGLIGKPWQDVINHTAEDFLTDPQQARIVMSNDRRIMDTGVPEENEEVVNGRGGEPRTWLSTKSPLFDPGGNVTGLVGVSIDITGRKEAERKVQALQTDLLFASRYAAMGEMASTLAHELNQPLAAIVSYLSGCRSIIGSGNRDDGQSLLTGIDGATGQAMRAAQIIRSLRQYVSLGAPGREPENLSALVRDGAILIAVNASAKGIAITLDLEVESILVRVDKVQIHQVIFNLARNAIEAMRHATRRELRITARPLNSRIVQISVIDWGTGIEPATKERLFTPFASAKPEGMGIGLSICRTIVESHGGTLLMEDNPEGGAIFRFTLEVVRTEEPPGPDGESAK